MTGPGTLSMVEVLDGSEALVLLRQPWTKLADKVGSGYFQSWEWVAAWHEILEPHSRLVFLVVRDLAGDLAGLLSLAWLTRSLHRKLPARLPYLGLAGSGAGAGDHLGPLVASPEVLQMLAEAAITAAGRKSIFFENLDGAFGSAMSGLQASAVDSIRCPYIDLRRPFESNWSKKQRENVRRRDRQLREMGFRGRWIGPGPGLADELGSLQRLHLHRWQSLGGAGLFDARRMGFLRRLAELASPPAGPWLYLLERDGEAAAGLLGFQYGRTFSSYKTGWNPDFAKYGAGIALTVAALRRAHDEGLAIFDMLRGAEAHKYSLGASDHSDVSLMWRRGISGTLLFARERLSSRRSPESSGRNALTSVAFDKAKDKPA